MEFNMDKWIEMLGYIVLFCHMHLFNRAEGKIFTDRQNCLVNCCSKWLSPFLRDHCHKRCMFERDFTQTLFIYDLS